MLKHKRWMVWDLLYLRWLLGRGSCEQLLSFVGDEFEQETFFIEDPNGNVLEMKTMVNPEVLFKKG